ncbi:MAG: hypothetical protein AB7P40_27420 [Chloroflexota bacterium]
MAIFALSVVVLGFEADIAGFEADESDYVATSRYFGYLFLDRDVERKEWGSNHWTRTQPPLTRYIIGAWLTGYGYDLEKMNQPYVSTASSFEVNRMKGRVPTDEVLARARQPMVLLGAGVITLLYALGVLLGGPVGGLSAAALALTSAFLRYTLVHAWAEAPIAFFLLLSALLAAVGAQRVVAGTGRWLGWSLALGLALGLASATKLTGLVGIPLVGAVAAVVAALAWRAGGVEVAGRLLAWATLACTVALLVMVAVNPYLWRGPASGLVSMIEQRRDEMAFQQEQWPEFAVLNVADRPWLLAVGSTRVGPWGDLPAISVVIGLGLAALGLWSLRFRLRPAAGDAAALMVLAWAGGYLLAIFGGLGLSYPRYFLPACLLLLPLMGAGASWLWSSARQLARRRATMPDGSLSAASSARSR